MMRHCKSTSYVVLIFLACGLGCEPGISGRQDGESPAPTISPATAPNGTQIAGRIRWISDGDSFEFATNDGQSLTIRLEGIDAPERSQPMSDAARDALIGMTRDQTVWVIPSGTDRYNRTIANVHNGRVFINGEMIRRGLAWHYAKYNSDERLAKLQQDAQRAQIGIWQQQSPEPPWDFRKRNPR